MPLTEKQKEYQREYYQKNRDKRIRQAGEFQAARKEERKRYMAEYYAENKQGWNEISPEQRAERNAARRERYQTDADFREAHKGKVKEWQEANPDKRHSQRVRKYGITRADYLAMLEAQGGGCAICGSTTPGANRGPNARFHVDHCHSTGVVRGLLCNECNLGIGKFKDSPERLERAAMYLRASKR